MLLNYKAIIRRAIVLLALLGCVLSVLQQANNKISRYSHDEVQRNIQAVLDQNVETMTLLIDKHKTLVEATATKMSGFYASPELVKDFIRRQEASKDIYKYYRIGFIYPDGSALSSDGYLGNLGFREYFQKSMQGEVFITSVTRSVLDKKHPLVNIISAPVCNDEGKIVGVIFETIPNSILSDSMSRGIFAEFGSNALIDNDGDIVAANNSSLLLSQHRDLLSYATLDTDQKHLSVWQQRLTNSSNSSVMYFERDGGQYLHFAPIFLDRVQEPLHVAVLLGQSSIEAQTSHFTNYIYNIFAALFAAALIGVLYYFFDISVQESKNRKELEKIAYVSPFTEGPTYAYLKKKLAKEKRSGYIVYMDMRDFEIIRSTLGNERAEGLLKDIWTKTIEELGPKDIGGHIVNDFFALFLEAKDVASVESRLRKINEKFLMMSTAKDLPNLEAAFGLAPYSHGDDIDIALSKADIAKQSVLSQRDNFYAVYGEAYTQAYVEQVELEKSFPQALHDKRYEVWLQPKFDCFTNRIIGAEALVRLRNAEGQLVPPLKFIPLFEKNGLIRQLDEYVFRTVCEIQKQRLAAQEKVVPISVNLSRVSLYYRNIVNRYAAIMQEVGVSSELVPLEITESAAVDNKDILRLTQDFSTHGFKLHMDDFGSGYSSLAALNELPFETLKLDKSIIDFIGTDHGNALVKHTIQLAHELGMSVIAEGVETQEQIDYLKTLNCHCVQGYYYSKPVEYKEFEHMLQQG